MGTPDGGGSVGTVVAYGGKDGVRYNRIDKRDLEDLS